MQEREIADVIHMSSEIKKFNGAIVVLDRLGTKGIWKSDPINALKVWNNLDSTLKRVEKQMTEEHEVYRRLGYYSEIATISDTMIWSMHAKNGSQYDLLKVVKGAMAVTLNIAFFQSIFLRGCISIGEYYKADSGTSIIGPAIDEAAQYYESTSWIGVSLAPSAHLVIRAESDKERFGFHTYDIPLTHGVERNGIAIDWFRPSTPSNDAEIKKKLMGLMRQSTDVDISLKYRNTLDFLEYVEHNTKKV